MGVKKVEDEVEKEVVDIFENVLGRKLTEDEIECNSLSEIKGWDSLIHISLIVAIEEKFGCTVEPEEGQEMKKGIKSIVKIIEREA